MPTSEPLDDDVQVDAETARADAVSALRHVIGQRPAGEVRPQQVTMVEAVTDAVHSGRHLLVQAGTGTGKTFGYLVPVITSGKRAVISTATKQLSEQIAAQDLPFLTEQLVRPDGQRPTFALLKGRNNYVCLRKVDDLKALEAEAGEQGQDDITEALFEVEDGRRPTKRDLDELNRLLVWAEETSTGDYTQAPTCGDKTWKQVSTDAAGCVGAQSCAFASKCFSERARAASKTADVVVTNHAMLAADMVSPAGLFSDADVVIFDEAHEVQEYLSRAWGVDVSAPEIVRALGDAKRTIPKGDAAVATNATLANAVKDCDALGEALTSCPAGVLKELDNPLKGLLEDANRSLRVVVSSMARHQSEVSDVAAGLRLVSAAKKVEELADTLVTFMNADSMTVRWVEEGRGKNPATLRTSPLWIGEMLLDLLGDRTMVCTSATVAVGGSFDEPARAFGLLADPDSYRAVDVGTPFDYRHQAMLYIPQAPFPAPVGADRVEHTKAVKEELEALIRAAGGRTLALFTTRYDAEDAGRHLRGVLTTPVLVQGDKPPAALLEEFEEVEESTLCATMGFWQGVNVLGPSLSLVTMNKLPFAPFNEPLLNARLEAASAEGRNGFTEIYVADAATKIAQGFGRLVRCATDRGVVAILDTRLRTKGYGPLILKTLPSTGIFSDREIVANALRRLTGADSAA